MAQVFHRSMNSVAKMSIVSAVLLAGSIFTGLVFIVRGPLVTNVGIAPSQPVQFSHEHHYSGLGIDCRYCHTSVENSSFANIPPTSTCMNCHSQIWYTSPILEPVRTSYRTGKPLEWNRVHNLADFVYFNHSIHVNKGIGCVSCHGRVDKMQLIYKDQPLTMEWCLKCHRNPENNLRPLDKIFDFEWHATNPEDEKAPHEASAVLKSEHGEKAPAKVNPDLLKGGEKFYINSEPQIELGKKLIQKYGIPSSRFLISCSTCHR